MLLETLIAVPLPVRETVTLPTSWVDGLRNLLLEGSFAERHEIPDATPAGVLARLHRAVRTLDPNGRVVLGSGALEALEALEQAAPRPDLGEMPEAWQQGLADGTLRFTGLTGRLEFTLGGRLLTRVRAGEPALRLVLRAVYRGILPAAEALPEVPGDPASGSKLGADPSYEADLLHSLRQRHALERLRALLLAEGDALTAALGHALADQASGPPETLGRVLVLDSLEGLEGLARGFSPAARRCIVAAGKAFSRIAPSIDAVYRLTSEGQLMVWRGQDQAFRQVDEGSVDPWREEEEAR
jgi:hypothetical protein